MIIIPRLLMYALKEKLSGYPAVAILGPRQIGKTTLAKQCIKPLGGVRVDLEDYAVLEALRENPRRYLKQYAGRLVILDEVQRFPDLFMMLRVIIDEYIMEGRKTHHFLLLGSASKELLKQSSESLAGRISYLELAGLLPAEILEDVHKPYDSLNTLWLRGGFPNSFTASTEKLCFSRLKDLTRTYVERDIPQLSSKTIPAEELMKFWSYLAYVQGEPYNAAKVTSTLELPNIHPTHYLDILTDLMLVRKLRPWSHTKFRKRLTKSPRVYIRDSGILHALLNITDFPTLLHHPIRGKSWEGFVIECILNSLPDQFIFPYFYRTASLGEEIDLLLEIKVGTYIAIDITSVNTAKVSKGFYKACEDIGVTQKFIICTSENPYFLADDTRVMPIHCFLSELHEIIETCSNT